MNIGIPKERRAFEYRVGLTPTGVNMLVKQGHTCYVEHDAGLGAGFSDQEYEKAGARIAYSPHEVFGRADIGVDFGRNTFTYCHDVFKAMVYVLRDGNNSLGNPVH